MVLDRHILLAHFPKLTHKRYRELSAAFSDITKAWGADARELKQIGWEDNLIHEFIVWRDALREDAIAQTLANEGIQCIPLTHPEYPALLKTVYDPPICLFVRGTLRPLLHPIAVIGSRKNTQYGKQVTEILVSELTKAGMTIVSGLAIGIDAIAHSVTLDHGGHTIAVLGSGVDRQHVHPRTHFALSEHILQRGGALISEYPPGTMPNTYTFPQRNRIIAGISDAALVIEAGETSGALITAQCALEYGREVFGVPQNITSPTSIGVNRLIALGARPVTRAQDILESFHLNSLTPPLTQVPSEQDLSPTAATILHYLGREPVHIDHIIKQTLLPSATVMSQLTIMEMNARVKNLGGMMYVRTQ